MGDSETKHPRPNDSVVVMAVTMPVVVVVVVANLLDNRGLGGPNCSLQAPYIRQVCGQTGTAVWQTFR
jgi:hypothetical protein